jgi:hypothetical protein
MFCCRVGRKDIQENSNQYPGTQLIPGQIPYNPSSTPPRNPPYVPPYDLPSLSNEPMILQDVVRHSTPGTPGRDPAYRPKAPLLLVSTKMGHKPAKPITNPSRTLYIKDGVVDLRPTPLPPTEESFAALMDEINPKTAHIRVLLLSGHPLNDSCVRMVSLWAAHSQTLEHLALAGCKLKSLSLKVMLSLSSETAQCSNLHTLDLSHNQIDLPTVRGIAKVLTRPSCYLQVLVIHHNPLTLEGVVELVETDTLVHLDCRNTFVVPPSKPSLEMDRYSPTFIHDQLYIRIMDRVE